MSLHISLDIKYIVQNKWKARLVVFLFGCRECGAELRRIMKTARPIR